MAPVLPNSFNRRSARSLHPRGTSGSWRLHATPEDFILESWSEGFMVGALLIMACITIANMRGGVLLHKLILAEQLFAMMHGTFCFMAFRGYGWYLSSTAALLYCSWVIHNSVAWLKIRPFFLEPRSLFKPKTGKWVARVYIATLICTIPPIILQIFDNFRYFNNINDLYQHVRPYEPLMRDPWWVFTCITLFHIIRKCYGTTVFELIKRSPRFGILLIAINLALIFTVCDIIASIKNFTGSTDGINPWWKLSLVFKYLTDTIMLDDFKTELKKLGIKRIQKEEKRRASVALVLDDNDQVFSSKADGDELEFSHVSLAGTNSRNLASTTNGNARQPPQREQVGRMGKKVSKLPGLASFHFGHREDEEKGRESGREEDEEPPEDDGARRVWQMRKSLGVVDWKTG